MAKLIDKRSEFIVPSQLNLFQIPSTWAGINKLRRREIPTVDAISSTGPYYKFRIFREPVVLRLDTITVSMDLTVVQEDGTALPPNANVSVIQLIGDCFWKQVIFEVNGTEVCNSTNHSYRAMITTELSQSLAVKSEYLSVAGYKAEAGSPDDPKGQGHLARKALIAESKALYLEGRIHFDMGSQNKILLSMTDVQFILFRHADNFLLNSYDVGANYKIRVRNLKLNIDCLELQPGMSIELEKKLATTMACYDTVRVETKILTIPAGQRSAPGTAFFTGPVPRKMYVALVDAESYFGKYSKNCFNFQSFDIKNISVEVSGVSTPEHQYQMDFANHNYGRAWRDLHATLDMIDNNRSNGLRYSDFRSGYAIFGFKLSAVEGSGFDFVKSGITSIKIELGTDSPGPQGIVAIVLAEFDHITFLDIFRNSYRTE
jgi:hypothetical protein